jgi:hypothetical protein
MKQHPQIKSRQNVKERGEVFTAEREVRAMCGLAGVKDAIADIEKRILEPAAGNGNFLAEILQRRINAIHQTDKSFYVLVALANIYAVELDSENVTEARQRLKEITMKVVNKSYEQAVDTILETNIIKGNFLTRDKKAIPLYEYVPNYKRQTFSISKHSLREVLLTAKKTKPNVPLSNIGQCIDELKHPKLNVKKIKVKPKAAEQLVLFSEMKPPELFDEKMKKLKTMAGQ